MKIVIKYILLNMTLCLLLGFNFKMNAQTVQKENQQDFLLVHNSTIPAPVQYGIDVLKKTFANKGISISEYNEIPKKTEVPIIITGVYSNNKFIRSIINDKTAFLLKEPEALMIKKIKWNGISTVVITGTDNVGTMYALLEVADEIRALRSNSEVIKIIKEANEKPFATVRSLSTYVFEQQVRNGYFHDPNYWDKLFQQLAESRINYYDLIFKYPAPVYTLFFNVDGWTPDQTRGLKATSEEQLKI